MIICSNRYIDAPEGGLLEPIILFKTEASFAAPEEPWHAASQIAVGWI